jgi:ribokinase
MTMPFATHPAGARLAVFGTLNVDLVWQVVALPRPGETVMALATERQFGGKGANEAVAAARQGASVALVGAVGEDAEGCAYLEHLAREGIDTAAVARSSGGATGTAHVYVDAAGENLIVVDPGANARIDPASLDRLLPRVARLLVQLEAGTAAGVAALRKAAAAGVPALLNASPVSADFPWGQVDIDTVIVNEYECAACFGAGPAEIRALTPELRRALLVRCRVRHIVVTQGAEPTLHFTTEGCDEIATFSVQPRDTVGAGDTFAGALAAQLAEGRAWPKALLHANVAAALSTLAIGAQAAMPTRAAVVAALAAAAPSVR